MISMASTESWASLMAFATVFFLLVLIQESLGNEESEREDGGYDKSPSLTKQEDNSKFSETEEGAQVDLASSSIQRNHETPSRTANAIESQDVGGGANEDLQLKNEEQVKLEQKIEIKENPEPDLVSDVSFIPSQRLVQLFPEITLVQACSLLSDAGVDANDPLSTMDQDTISAIQRVVDDLVMVYYPDPGPAEEPTVQCPCCYEDVAIENMVSCKDEGHVFCNECVRKYAETKIFGSASLGICRETGEATTELLCIAESCSSGFRQSLLETALPQKLLEQYGELQGNLNLKKANLEHLCTCPKCGFKAVLPPTEKILRCPVDDCNFASCRECGEAAHAPLSCAQVKTTKKDQMRHKMEEAMTAALLRPCPNPNCQNELLKNGGCNKLTCPCGWIMCNVCKQTIDGYEHFCQGFDCNHKTCGKCSLYKSTKKDDKRAIEQAHREGQEEARRLEQSDADDVPNPEVKVRKRRNRLFRFRRTARRIEV